MEEKELSKKELKLKQDIEKLSYAETMKKLNISKATVGKIRKRLGIKGTLKKPTALDKILRDMTLTEEKTTRFKQQPAQPQQEPKNTLKEEVGNLLKISDDEIGVRDILEKFKEHNKDEIIKILKQLLKEGNIFIPKKYYVKWVE